NRPMSRLLFGSALAAWTLTSLPSVAAPRQASVHCPGRGAATPGQRPAPVEVSAAIDGSNYALRVKFDRLPWGDECRSRCADVVLLWDTDNDRNTGLSPEGAAPEKGADLAVVIQGTRERREKGTEGFLRVKVWGLPDGAAHVEDGKILAQLDHRRDGDRI